MKQVFTKRRTAFAKRCAKYLKYVLNDHFVLFLLLGVGFLMVQYSQLLRHLPKDTWLLQLVLGIGVLLVSFVGDFNAYLESPDQQFLLVKEEEVIVQLKQAKKRGFLFWSVFQVAVVALFFPLALALKWPVVLYLLLALLGLVLKWAWFSYRERQLLLGHKLNWSKAINHDKAQQQAVLKFFSLFTQVKGVSQTVKRRPYLDGLLRLFQTGTWDYLFARAFLRSGDYLALSIRLIVLSVLCLLGIPQELVALGLVILLNYLLLFQLMALYKHYDYQYLTRLFPLDVKAKQHSLRRFLSRLLFLVLGIEVLAALFGQVSMTVLGGLLLSQLVLTLVYLPYKLQKMD